MGVEMVKFFSLFRCFLSMNIKKILEYRMDFIIGIIPSIISSLFGLIFISLIFQNIQSLTGLSYYNCQMIYGFFLLSSSLERILCGNFQQLRGYIFNGTLDLIFTRPINLLLHLMFLNFNEEYFIQFIIGIGVVIHSAISSGLHFSILTLCLITYVSVLGTLLLVSITIITSSLYFISDGTFSLFNAVNNLTTYLKYPITIFGKTIRFFLTWVLPLSAVSFLPMQLASEGFNNHLLYIIYLTIIIVALLMLSVKIFFYGAKKYQSTGN